MGSRLRLLARLSSANIRRHRVRWVLTTFGIGVGVAAFTGVLAISRSIIHAFEQSVVRTAGRAQLQASNGTAGIDAELVDVIGAVPGVEVASGNVQYSVTVPALERRLAILGILLGGEQRYRETQFGPGVLDVPDSLEFVLEKDSIAVSTEVLDEQGWKVGSLIEVVGPKGRRKLTVRGRVRGEGALRVFGGDVGVMDAHAAQDAFGQLDRFHWVDVVVGDGWSIEEVRADIARAITGRGIVDTPMGRGQRMEAMLSTLRWMLTVSGIVAMLVAVFLIHHTVATAIRQRREDLTRLRALGASRSLLSRYLLTEAIVIGLVGSLLGIAAGMGFSVVAATLFNEPVSRMYAPIPTPGLALTTGELIAALGLGLGTVLAAALGPCLGVLRLRPLAAQRAGTQTSSRVWVWPVAALGASVIVLGMGSAHLCGRVGFAGGVLTVGVFSGSVFLGTTLIVPLVFVCISPLMGPLLRKGWGILGAWTWQQVGKRQFHAATTVGALAAGVAFSVAVTTLLGSYRNAFVDWINQVLAADVFISAGDNVSLLSGPTVDLGLAEEVSGLEGVARVMPWRLMEVEFRGKPIIVQGLSETLIERWHPDMLLNHRAGEVVISDTLAQRYDLMVGDTLELPAPITPLSLTISGVAPDYLLDLGNVKVGWSLFARHFGERSANYLFVDAKPGVSGRDLKRRIEGLTATRYDVSVLTGSELRSLVDSLIDQSFALTYALQMLTVVVTVLAMVNATSAGIIDRSADLNVWRAMGLERTRLIRLLTVEAALLGLVGSLLGLCSGSLVGNTLVNVIAPVVAGFTMQVRIPTAAMVTLVILTMAAAAVAATSVASRQTRHAVAAAKLEI